MASAAVVAPTDAPRPLIARSSHLEVFRPAEVRADRVDIGLPGTDGYEVPRRLRREPSLDGVYLVAQTGYGSESDRRHSAEAGFDDHLVKPVEFGAVRRVLERTLVGSPGGPD
jgi:CheY-like chemotaxis protein